MSGISFDIFARDKASPTIERVGRSMGGLEKAASLLGAVGGAAIFEFGKKSVEAFTDGQVAHEALLDSYKRFPAMANVSKASLFDLADALERKTKFDHTAIESGESVLAQFHLTGKQVEQLTPLIADYAAKTGRDVPTAAELVGHALLGQGRALKEVGIKFKDTGSVGGNLTQVMAGLRTQVGGYAEHEGKTAAGQSAILHHRLTDLEEGIGSKLVPVLMTLAGAGISTIDWMQRNATMVKIVGAGIGILTVSVWGVNTATKVWTATTEAWQAITKTATAAQWLLNAALDANPIGIVTLALAALAVGLIYAYKHSETFRNIVNTGWHDVAAGAQWLWGSVLRPTFMFITNAWMTVAGAIIHGAASAFGWVPGIGDKLRGAATAFDHFRDNVNAALGGVRDRKVTVSAGLEMLAGGKTTLAYAARHQGMMTGGPVYQPGADPHSDSVVRALQPGEFVIRRDGSNIAEALAYYGHGMAAGGLVVDAVTPSSSAIGAAVGAGYDRGVSGAFASLLRSGAAGGGSGVARWAGMILQVLALLGQSPTLLGAVERRMNLESGGNPNAVNLWDSNAAAGHPSQGLMQVIAGTFAAYGGPFRGLGILNPLANTYAGLNYALHRYGSISAIDPLVRAGGYDSGGILQPGWTLAYNGTGKPETIRTFEQEQALGGIVVYVENPWTGEYHEARMRAVAQDNLAEAARRVRMGSR